ncbi:MAG: RnfABCDGE type electron transport complex subunit D [Gammaproteobacteria bacterium]|nr:RnfABCDGE type electron transport complex subunit D [Gammaproteobacteria bacterium]MCP4881747.1 RnfABCDGE type electron transport complex subunit D [Gammaproteobacteria bacterium]MDP6166317.1 RnfABCDGE type electron transport complex subunit D [Gammaproteobacteria bacterium]
MALFSSPHLHGGNHSQRLMLLVLAAAVPGLVAQIYWFGFGTLLNVIWAITLGLALEASVLLMRKRPLGFFLKDGSVIVTGLLLALALPPMAPWWLVSVATLFAVVFAKHLYGGLGNNPFNPAMAGYAICLIAFPTSMTLWTSSGEYFNLPDQWLWFWTEQGNVDAITQATPLDAMKHLQGNTIKEMLAANPTIVNYADAMFWINLAYLAGGLGLMLLKVFTWHAPVAMLSSLSIMAFLFGTGEPDLYAGPSEHLLLGATMLGAFFIITDPVSSATSRSGKLVFGVGIGVLIYIIRTWGAYPDAVAFAVLLMNLCAPLIDQYTKPKAYGQQH